VALTRHQIPSLLRRGEVRRVARGLYRRTDRPVTEMETLLMVARMVPDGIFCLLTALRVHEIGTQRPAEVWVAIGHKAREPKIRPWKGRFLPVPARATDAPTSGSEPPPPGYPRTGRRPPPGASAYPPALGESACGGRSRGRSGPGGDPPDPGRVCCRSLQARF
jgi:hypothetical protein